MCHVVRIIILASGSSGNCALVEGQSGSLLVDAGLSARTVLSLLSDASCDPSAIAAILLTHEHSDHTRGVYPLAHRLNVPVVGTQGSLDAFAATRKNGLSGIATVRCGYNGTWEGAGMEVVPFPASHDAAEPCGFFIRDGDQRFACCTDTGEILPAARDAMARSDTLVIESNHCPVMLKDGPYPEVLKRRIRSRRGHLSNTAAASFMRDLGDALPSLLTLAHLSEVNNTPEKALSSAREGAWLRIDDTEIQVAVNRECSTWPCQVRI